MGFHLFVENYVRHFLITSEAELAASTRPAARSAKASFFCLVFRNGLMLICVVVEWGIVFLY